jgi:hypothetical protein
MDKSGIGKTDGRQLMRKILVTAGFLLLALLVILQFFRPERNEDLRQTGNDLGRNLEVPADVSVVLQHSCYDCHSNDTRYPWYSWVSPVSWLLERHISHGKAELNFSEFGNLDRSAKITALSNLCEVLEEGSMPLKSYLLIHRDARLTAEETAAICKWSEAEAMKLIRAGTSQGAP